MAIRQRSEGGRDMRYKLLVSDLQNIKYRYMLDFVYHPISFSGQK